MPTWFIVNGKDWKPHVVEEVFLDALQTDMKKRGVDGEIKIKVTTSSSLDRGGMVFSDRPWEEFPVMGLTLGMPSELVETFYDLLKALPSRRFGRRVYYKLHCHWNCLVLTSAQRRALLSSLRLLLPAAEARAVAFYQARKAIPMFIVAPPPKRIP